MVTTLGTEIYPVWFFSPTDFLCLLLGMGIFLRNSISFLFFSWLLHKTKELIHKLKLNQPKFVVILLWKNQSHLKKKKKTKKNPQPNQLTTAWLGQRKQQFRAHSDTLFPVFPVLWVRIMAWKQTIRQRQTRGLRSLSQSQQGCQHSTAGWPGICRWFHWLDPCSKSPVTTLSSLSGALKVPVSKHRKQLAAENAARATQKWPRRRLHPVQAGRTLWHCYVFCPLFQC